MNWQITRPPLVNTTDFERFVAVLHANAAFFVPTVPIMIARAPGRLDLMGGIADYSGALVLELPLGVATFAAVQLVESPTVIIRSLESGLDVPDVTLTLTTLFPNNQPLDYAAAHTLLAADQRTAWAAYVAGVLVVLGRECGILPTSGLRILIASDVPAGKGVSSSAAIEVATMSAVVGARGQGSGVRGQEPDISPALQHREFPTPRAVALLCQMVENLVVGAPCGVMDQMTSALGEQGQLLALLCQPAEVQGSVALPPELAVWGIDSGIRHAVSGADYGSVRVGAFMGRQIIRRDGAAYSTQWANIAYLAEISPSLWEQHLRELVPAELRGDAFLARYGGTGDSVTTVDPARTYAVRQATAHPIYEHQRVQLFRALLEAQGQGSGVRGQGSGVRERSIARRFSAGNHGQRTTNNGQLLGELMFQAHASYSACGLGSSGTDLLVELVRSEREGGLYGAKITGGGSGGTVAVLGRSDAAEAIERVAARYAAATGHTPLILAGSSPGAAAWGTAQAAWR